MQVKDQLKIRMEQLGVSVGELATRLRVSNQTVRHWLNGRSFPGKRKAPLVERALSFKLDYSEGSISVDKTIESTLKEADLQMIRAYSHLPPEVKLLFARLAEAYTNVGAEGERDESHDPGREITVEDIVPFPEPQTRTAHAPAPRRSSPKR